MGISGKILLVGPSVGGSTDTFYDSVIDFTQSTDFLPFTAIKLALDANIQINS